MHMYAELINETDLRFVIIRYLSIPTNLKRYSIVALLSRLLGLIIARDNLI